MRSTTPSSTLFGRSFFPCSLLAPFLANHPLHFLQTKPELPLSLSHRHPKRSSAATRRAAFDHFLPKGSAGKSRVLATLDSSSTSSPLDLAVPLLRLRSTIRSSFLTRALASSERFHNPCYSTSADPPLCRSSSLSTGSVPKGLSSTPQGRLALATANDIQIVENGAKVATLPVAYTPTCVAISLAGATVAVGAEDLKVHLYNSKDVALLGSLELRNSPTAMAFSPDDSVRPPLLGPFSPIADSSPSTETRCRRLDRQGPAIRRRHSSLASLEMGPPDGSRAGRALELSGDALGGRQLGRVDSRLLARKAWGRCEREERSSRRCCDFALGRRRHAGERWSRWSGQEVRGQAVEWWWMRTVLLLYGDAAGSTRPSPPSSPVAIPPSSAEGSSESDSPSASSNTELRALLPPASAKTTQSAGCHSGGKASATHSS